MTLFKRFCAAATYLVKKDLKHRRLKWDGNLLEYQEFEFSGRPYTKKRWKTIHSYVVDDSKRQMPFDAYRAIRRSCEKI